MAGQFFKFTAHPFGQNNLCNAGPPCRNDFFLDPAHRQHLSGQRDLTGHGQGTGYFLTSGQGNQGCGNGDAGTGTVLGSGPFGHMKMNERIIKKFRVNFEKLGIGPDIRQGDGSGLLHDIPQLSRQFDACPPVMHLDRLNGQDHSA